MAPPGSEKELLAEMKPEWRFQIPNAKLFPPQASAYAGCHHWGSEATCYFVTKFFLYSSNFKVVFLIFTDGKFLSATLTLQTTTTKPLRVKPQQKCFGNMHLIHKEGANTTDTGHMERLLLFVMEMRG